MPITTLDPCTALIVVDLQKGTANPAVMPALRSVIQNTCVLLDVFRAANLPVVLVNVTGRAPGRTEQSLRNNGSSADYGEGWSDLLPELHRQPSDIVISKQSWGAFATTNLHQQLRAQSVTQVVVTGLSTSIGVEATARQAYEHGFNVSLAVDAMADPREDAHQYSIGKVFPRLGETGSTSEIIALVQRLLKDGKAVCPGASSRQ